MIYNRPDEKVFASGAKTGEISDYPDISRGWGVTLDQTQGKPPLEWFNALGLRTDQSIQYFLQNGIATWGESTEYPQYAIVKYNGKIWNAKKQNTGNEPAVDSEYWEQTALTLDEVKSFLASTFATTEEAQAGTATDKIISPAALASVVATTEQQGLIQIATDEEVTDGTNTAKAITPASLVSSFNNNKLAVNGYQILPNGLIMQWSKTGVTNGGFVSFPMPFPNASFVISGSDAGASQIGGSQYFGYYGATNKGFYVMSSAKQSMSLSYIAFGY